MHSKSGTHLPHNTDPPLGDAHRVKIMDGNWMSKKKLIICWQHKVHLSIQYHATSVCYFYPLCVPYNIFSFIQTNIRETQGLLLNPEGNLRLIEGAWAVFQAPSSMLEFNRPWGDLVVSWGYLRELTMARTDLSGLAMAWILTTRPE